MRAPRLLPRSLLALFALAAGCADSCACGGGASPGGASREHERAAGAGAKATTAAAADAGEAPERRPSWQPAPDSELTRKLAEIKAALETDETYDKLATEKTLAAPLADALGGYEAQGPAAFTVREAGGAKLPVSARSYKDGDKTVRIKVTDTAQLPGARRVVSGRLTMIGNEAVGNERGVLLRGKDPAVTAYFARQRVSRASAILGGRYLVQVLINNTDEPEDALRVLERIDPARLR